MKIFISRKDSVFLLVFCFFLFNCFSQINHSKTVKVGYYENEVFQEGASENLIKKGYAYEYYRKLSEYTGWNYEYVYGTFIDLYTELKEGRIDLLAGLAYTEERNKQFFYEDLPMGSTQYYLIKKIDDLSITSNKKSLIGKTIGVQNSIMVQILRNWLLENHINANVVVYDDVSSLFAEYDNKKLDLIIVESAGTYGRKDSNVIFSIGKTDYYLCVSKKRPDIIQELNKAHEQLLIDNPNFVNNLFVKYYSESISSTAFSEEEILYLDNLKEISIGYLNHYLPYCDTDSNGKLTGFLKDIIPEELNKLGLIDKIHINYKVYDSFSELIQALNENKIDVAFPVGGGLYFSEQRGFYQSQPVINSTVALIYTESFEKNHATVFAVNKNNDMQYYFIKTQFPEAIVKFYNSVEDCLKAVELGDVDYTSLNGLRVNQILKNSRFRKLNYRLIAQTDERCFGVKIGNEQLLKILNRGINSLGEQYILNQAYPYTEGLFSYSLGDYIKSVLVVILPLIFITGLILIIHNVRTKRKLRKLNLQLEQARKNTERYLAEMIRYVSSEADADKILNQLVDYIGRNSNPHRVYVFEENEQGSFDNTYEWCNQGISAEKENLQNVPYHGVIETWIKEFEKQGNVIIKDVEAYKNVSMPIYQILKPQNIQTLAAIPLRSQGKIIGFIGVDNVPVSTINDIADLLNLVEFFFALMIRLRNSAKYLEKIAMHDSLTGFFNRRAYEEEIQTLKANKYSDSFVYVSIDINGLKLANDTLGHEAGDELIIGASKCISKAMGEKGKFYRTGGDEFVALINVEKSEVEKLVQKLYKECEKWKGDLVNELSLSVGYIYAKENPDLSLHEISVLADKKMYEDKANFYRKSGVDRRGQQDAHKALCQLYTKILKINLTKDSYNIINMDENERSLDKGFSDAISQWLKDFGKSGQVHPEDLEEYLHLTDLNYMRDYFKHNKTSLHIFYRRKINETVFKQFMMEIIPANDYSEDNQSLFLYVKNIDK